MREGLCGAAGGQKSRLIPHACVQCDWVYMQSRCGLGMQGLWGSAWREVIPRGHRSLEDARAVHTCGVACALDCVGVSCDGATHGLVPRLW